MKMWRIAAFALTAFLLLPAMPASAGGSWMEGRRAYGIGQTAELRGSFSMSGSLEGKLSDGPYVAYLAPIEIYDVDHSRAIRLGEIRMERSEVWGVVASVSFTVPDVPTGEYHVTYCNEPCTVDGIGDLVGGDAFYIAPTRAQAILLWRVERLSWRVADARQEGRAKERRALEQLEGSGQTHAREIALAREEIATLEARIGELRAASARDAEPTVAGWVVVVAAFAVVVGLIAAAAIVRRQHALVVPDTIPDGLELLELDLRR